MAKPKRFNEILIARINERLAATGKNARSASMEATDSDGTIQNILQGNSYSPRSDTMAKLAVALDTTPAYLLGHSHDPGSGLPSMPSGKSGYTPPPSFEDAQEMIPVYASAEGGDGAMIIDNEPISRIPRPIESGTASGVYGVVIEGESMSRAYRPGDIAWVNPKLRERRDEDCIFRRFDNITGEAKAMIKALIKYSATEWTVEQLNPPKTFKLDRAEWPECYRVIGRTIRI